MDTKTQHKHTFDIFDGDGNSLATVTLYSMGWNAANREIVRIAKSLSDDWSVIAESEKDDCNSTQFITDHVEVRS